MPLDLKKELLENNVIMVVVPNESYTKNVLGVVKQLNNIGEGVCYASLNQMVDVLMKSLERNKIDHSKFLFIDVITKTVETNPKAYDNCAYVDSPSALTGLCIAINSALQRKELKTLFFDSISTLLLYSDRKTVIKAIQSIVNHVKRNNAKAIFIALEEDAKKGLLKETGMYINKTMHIGGKVENGSN
jgi:hypothetical protein